MAVQFGESFKGAESTHVAHLQKAYIERLVYEF